MNARVQDVRQGPALLRRARYADIDAVTALGIEALEKFSHPDLRVDPKKVRAMAQRVQMPGNYCHVMERDGVVVAAVSAIVEPMIFHERLCASVVQFYTTSAGDGLPLIRHFLRWARARHGIKQIVFTLEVQAKPEIRYVLARLGLTEQHPVFVEVR